MKEKNKDDLIGELGLHAHPEGGYYKEIYRSDETVEVMRKGRLVTRSLFTSIYFLLGEEDKSHFHRIESDEIWYWHTGGTVYIHSFLPGGELKIVALGPPEKIGNHLQVLVPKNTWFAAKPEKGNDFVLVSCSVSPGFDFKDFELAKREDLLETYGHHHRIIIEELT
jgi:uncharacterized protein